MDQCEKILLIQDQVLAKPGGQIRAVYFPLDSFILQHMKVAPVGGIGISLVGREGIYGASVAFGVWGSTTHASVAGGGGVLRMDAGHFCDLVSDSSALQHALDMQLYVQLQQTSQMAACAVFHVVEKRLAYWLLMIHDRVKADRILMTHQQLARMLGVRRSGVSTAAGTLQQRKLISYSRGHITILNRKELEKFACRCYRSVRTQTRRINAGAGADGLAA